MSATAPLCGPAGVRERVLLLVDFQRGFMRPELEGLIGPMQALVGDPFFGRVIATQFVNEEGSLWQLVLGWHRLETAEEQALCIVLPAHGRVVAKRSYGLPPGLLAELVEQAPEVYLAGLETDVCITAVTAQLFDAGLPPRILTEYVGTTKGAEQQEYGLRALGRLAGKANLVADFAAWKGALALGQVRTEVH